VLPPEDGAGVVVVVSCSSDDPESPLLLKLKQLKNVFFGHMSYILKINLVNLFFFAGVLG
jgi:hypothetical protein